MNSTFRRPFVISIYLLRHDNYLKYQINTKLSNTRSDDALTRLVAIDKESKIVRLVHFTAQEYFERNPLLDRDVAQEKISSACIAYFIPGRFQPGSL